PFVQEHFELLIVGIVAVSIIPTVVGLVKAKLGKKSA
ncbi:MAG: DedA family protein, partial [Collinsella sp.]